MRWILLLLLALAGCAGRIHHPELKQRYVAAPVIQAVPSERDTETPGRIQIAEKKQAPCVAREQIPSEPPSIADKLTGVARYDVGPLAQSARDLREALRKARELLLKCAESPALENGRRKG